MSNMIHAQAYFCEPRIDQDVCYSELEPLSAAFNFLLLIFTLICIFDLSCYYLLIPFSPTRRVLRVVFYIFYTVLCWIAVFFTFTNATWIYIGTLQAPRKLAHYALAPVLIIGILLKYFAKQRK